MAAEDMWYVTISRQHIRVGGGIFVRVCMVQELTPICTDPDLRRFRHRGSLR